MPLTTASGGLLSDVQGWIQQHATQQPVNDGQCQQVASTRPLAATSTLTETIKTPLGTETLQPDEIARITRHKPERDQVNWLAENQWVFHMNGKGEIIVGRMYARLRMCGIDPAVR